MATAERKDALSWPNHQIAPISARNSSAFWIDRKGGFGSSQMSPEGGRGEMGLVAMCLGPT